MPEVESAYVDDPVLVSSPPQFGHGANSYGSAFSPFLLAEVLPTVDVGGDWTHGPVGSAVMFSCPHVPYSSAMVGLTLIWRE
jgi:hypothetical protein